jgi:hypothetical protein
MINQNQTLDMSKIAKWKLQPLSTRDYNTLTQYRSTVKAALAQLPGLKPRARVPVCKLLNGYKMMSKSKVHYYSHFKQPL